ncbi:hypothetical protein [Actinoallomurus iriomotensis]|nr:hypothetical protein [Actinoallomurus iriomotensis]
MWRPSSAEANSLILTVAGMTRVAVGGWSTPNYAFEELFRAAEADPEVFLDIVDATLAVTTGGEEDLRRALELCGSVWTVSPDGRSLQRRVAPAMVSAAERAMSPLDAASEELRLAWAAAYGRGPDASDAWDHSIKAAESVLIPVVVPKKAKATMGDVLGQLRRPENGWRLVLPGADGDHAVAPLVGMLRLLWPNPDRHGAGQRRTPTLEEAQAVVQLTVTIVQWARDGVLRK